MDPVTYEKFRNKFGQLGINVDGGVDRWVFTVSFGSDICVVTKQMDNDNFELIHVYENNSASTQYFDLSFDEIINFVIERGQ